MSDTAHGHATDETWLSQELGLSIDTYIQEFRKAMPDDCGTARAIDRGASWDRIALMAQLDGFVIFAQELRAAQREVRSDRRPVRRLYLAWNADDA